ncbi:hypothetical protein N9B82_04985 [Saprospiraceae bacterium]|nr:hypothetical protein [Saprospiraceae bacterium]
MKIPLLFFLILVNFGYVVTVAEALVAQGYKNLDTSKLKNDYKLDSTKIVTYITKEDCRNYGVPEMEFTITTPSQYKKTLNSKEKGILRFVKTLSDSQFEELQIATHKFDAKFSAEQEILQLEEFKNMPEIKNNPDLTITVFSNIKVGSRNLTVYLQKVQNSSGKYPTDLPLNTLGITVPSSDGWSALILAFNKFSIDESNLFSEDELSILRSIKIN